MRLANRSPLMGLALPGLVHTTSSTGGFDEGTAIHENALSQRFDRFYQSRTLMDKVKANGDEKVVDSKQESAKGTLRNTQRRFQTTFRSRWWLSLESDIYGRYCYVHIDEHNKYSENLIKTFVESRRDNRNRL